VDSLSLHVIRIMFISPCIFNFATCRAPLRAIVPGHVGVRNVKWLNGIVISDVEAPGPWQRGMAYKVRAFLF